MPLPDTNTREARCPCSLATMCAQVIRGSAAGAKKAEPDLTDHSEIPPQSCAPCALLLCTKVPFSSWLANGLPITCAERSQIFRARCAFAGKGIDASPSGQI